MTTIVWFRRDLRLADNPALFEAAKTGTVLPVFIHEEGTSGGASLWWLHHSLKALQETLPHLVLLQGDPRVLIPWLVQEAGAGAVYWNRLYDPQSIERDTELKAGLKSEGIQVKSFNASLLNEPWELETKAGGPFKVFTPFWRAVQARPTAAPLGNPDRLETVSHSSGLELAQLDLLPIEPNWAEGWQTIWHPGEVGAQTRLQNFLNCGLANYGELRNRPDLENVSRLSAPLHFGEISPRQIWQKTLQKVQSETHLKSDGTKFLSEIAWREFSHHLLYHFPTLQTQNWKTTFDAYPWRESASDLKNWQMGQTGYPIVDAGMQELWQTGYMHNRVRMIVASFLVKHLRLHWKHGANWFLDTLVDADIANNSAGWQWVAGSGADAAPYFRIFNPMSQAAKFDPEGRYIRKWLPQLSELEPPHLFAPFEAPEDVLTMANVKLGTTYPWPIVDHAQARKDALAGYERVKQMGQNAA